MFKGKKACCIVKENFQWDWICFTQCEGHSKRKQTSISGCL